MATDQRVITVTQIFINSHHKWRASKEKWKAKKEGTKPAADEVARDSSFKLRYDIMEPINHDGMPSPSAWPALPRKPDDSPCPPGGPPNARRSENTRVPGTN
ncbi:hypothetical protein LZ31DRAFT_307593 [Colletotrichum somersetense]|nr:hypothetical protein LZ31DRAFT_307593 [Colletotrichum somersetense]